MQKSSKIKLMFAGGVGFLLLMGAVGFIVLRKITLYTPATPVTTIGASPAVEGKYSLVELAKHNTQNDCYIAYQNDVFNITWYVPKHEGGDIIIQQCGQVVDEFSSIHPGGPFTKRTIQLILQASKVGKLL